MNDDARHEMVSTGMHFMRLIMENYGMEKGTEVWDAITQSMDPTFKGQVLFGLMMGELHPVVTLGPQNVPITGSNRVSMIKAIRTITGLGLKEAKDLSDSQLSGHTIRLHCKEVKSRVTALNVLRTGGFLV